MTHSEAIKLSDELGKLICTESNLHIRKGKLLEMRKNIELTYNVHHPEIKGFLFVLDSAIENCEEVK